MPSMYNRGWSLDHLIQWIIIQISPETLSKSKGQHFPHPFITKSVPSKLNFPSISIAEIVCCVHQPHPARGHGLSSSSMAHLLPSCEATPLSTRSCVSGQSLTGVDIFSLISSWLAENGADVSLSGIFSSCYILPIKFPAVPEDFRLGISQSFHSRCKSNAFSFSFAS